MGGYGSGRRRFPARSAVEDFHQVDANVLARKKLFLPGERLGIIRWSRGDRETGACAIRTTIDDKQAICVFQFNDEETIVPLSWYAPGYGGRRFFFICPKCGRRMRTLSFKGNKIACRVCLGLTYHSSKIVHYFDSFYRQMAEGLTVHWYDVKKYFNIRFRAAKKGPKRARGRPRKQSFPPF